MKVFHSEIQNDHDAIRQEEAQYEEIPNMKIVDSDIAQINYYRIKQYTQELLDSELGLAVEDKSTIQDKANASGGGITKGMWL